MVAELLKHLDLQTALQSIAEGVTIAAADGTIVFSNAAADRILGITATNAPPDEWAAHYGVFLPDSETPFPTDRYPLVRALKGEHTKDVEMLIRNANRPDGALIAVTGSPVLGAAGEIAGAIVVFRDITELRKAQRVKDEFYAFFMHDLKSPLTTIVSLSELLLTGPEDGSELPQDLADIRRSAMRMRRMVVDFLDIHLADDGAFAIHAKPLPVADLLRRTFEDMAPRARAEGQELVAPEFASGVSILADEDILLRVLQNVIDNCVKYGPKGGKIWLDAQGGRAGLVRIRICDEGPGIPEELKARIFDKYATVERASYPRSGESRGLGLRFSAVAVEAHGGRIWVEDNEPTGAVFNIEIPTG